MSHKTHHVKVRDIPQMKPRLGQGRAGIRCKTKTPAISPIAQAIEKPLKILKYLKHKTKS